MFWTSTRYSPLFFCRLFIILGKFREITMTKIIIRSLQNSNTEYIPTKCRITRPPPPKPATNPLQFVKVAPPPLFKKAHEQIKKVEEIKKERKEIRDETEDWQQVSRLFFLFFLWFVLNRYPCIPSQSTICCVQGSSA